MRAKASQLEVLAYVMDALRRHEARYRLNRWPVPAGVAALVEEVGFRVSRGQDGSSDAAPLQRADGGPEARVAVRLESAAQMLEVSVSSIKRAVRDGSLPAVKLGGSTLIRVADLNAYVASLPTTKEAACR